MENLFYSIKKNIFKLSFLILSPIIHILRNLSLFRITHFEDTTLVVEEQRRRGQESRSFHSHQISTEPSLRCSTLKDKEELEEFQEVDETTNLVTLLEQRILC